MKKSIFASVAILCVFAFAGSALANYGYHYNKYGTGYWRDDSNDGNPYNNANYLGMNDD